VPPDAVIFDFDGTLAHSERAYLRAFRDAMLQHTGAAPTEAELSGFITSSHDDFASRFPSRAVRDAFEERYYEVHHEHLEVFAGVTEMLASLRRHGVALAVVSLKPRRAGELELDLCGLRESIDVAIWGDDVLVPKPAPDGVRAALDRLAAAAERTLVVGDSPADVAMARAAGVGAAGALWGGGCPLRLGAAGANVLLSTPADLLTHLGLPF
jgi:HAD superfamily hydrolase (TIGR01509 family)